MRSLLMVGSVVLLAACSTVTPSVSTTPSALPVSSVESDVTGRWMGTWIGTGLFESPREDSVILELRQVGYNGYGRVVFDGSTAAESVPWDVRREGLSGARVSATIVGSQVTVRHEMGSRFFTANLTRVGEDRMIGDVRGAAPGVQLLLTRAGRRVEQPQAKVLPAPPETPVTQPESDEPELLSVEDMPMQPDPVQIASVMPAEEPAQLPDPADRPRIADFVPAEDLKSVYFDFDSARLRHDAQDTLTTSATWLKEHEDLDVMIEGHCDEMGTTEYNQVLGHQRAQSVKATLAASGVDAERMTTISYGKERPVCTEKTEACRQQNRHVEFRVKSR
jgi:peptidoglycan-associated lipoprotein